MNAEAYRTIGVEMHGVTLNLRCDNERQLRYSQALLGNLVREPWERPDLEVTSTWTTPSSAAELDAPAFDVAGLDSYGKRLFIGDEQLVWTDTHQHKHLQLRFRLEGSRPCFDIVYRYLPSAGKLARFPDYEEKKFFDLLRYTVIFPIAWYLRRTRGWELVHASAVVDGTRGVLLAGPGGAGKTTTSVALMARAGMRLLTENLALTDGERIYSVSEPIRLTEESRGLLGDAIDGLEFQPGGLARKSMFVPPADDGPQGVQAALVFLMRFSERGFVRRLPPRSAYLSLHATNVLTLELNDFSWYAATLDLLWPEKATGYRPPLQKLTRSVPCYLLGIDRSRGTMPVVEQILACLRGQAHTVSQGVTP